MDSKWVTGIFLLGVCPGVTNAYSTGVAGLVASTIIAFFLLVMVIVLIALAVLWNEWYRDRMAKMGYRKGPRRSWRVCEFFWGQQSTHQSTTERPASVRLYSMPRVVERIEHVPASQVTTIERKVPVTDAWAAQVQVIKPAIPYEEKTQTLDFLSEEEPSYETRNISRNTTHVIMGRSSRRSGSPEPSTQAVYVTPDSTTHATTLHTSQKVTTVTPEPYHVQLESEKQNLSATNREYMGASTKQASDYYDSAENARNHYEEAVVVF